MNCSRVGIGHLVGEVPGVALRHYEAVFGVDIVLGHEVTQLT